MKKIALVIIITCLMFLGGIVYLKLMKLDLSNEIKNEKVDINFNFNEIPLFEFKTLTGKIFSKYNLEKNKSTIIVYFDPDCEKCFKSAKIFVKFEKLHHQSQVLFVSSNDKERIKAYMKKFNLDKVSNLSFYQSSANDFYKNFKETSTPTYFFYDSKGKHIKTINEEVPINIFLRYLKATQ